MADDTEYIDDLDPILELAPTDSFVVETLEGTRRILFKDFILGSDNVDFYEEITANTVAVVALSSEVLALDTDVTNINSGLTGLSAAYNESIKSGFLYATINAAGTLTISSSSSNIASVILTDGGSRILVTAVSDLSLNNAAINVTLDDSISASSVTDNFISYTPIVDNRTSTSFKVGLNAISNAFTSVSLPTAVNATSETFNPVTSITSTPGAITPVTNITTTTTSVMLNPSGTGNVIQTVTPVIESQPIVSSVVANTTAKTIVNAVSVTSTSYTLMVSDNLGNGNSMKDVEFNISFRYV